MSYRQREVSLDALSAQPSQGLRRMSLRDGADAVVRIVSLVVFVQDHPVSQRIIAGHQGAPF